MYFPRKYSCLNHSHARKFCSLILQVYFVFHLDLLVNWEGPFSCDFPCFEPTSSKVSVREYYFVIHYNYEDRYGWNILMVIMKTWFVGERIWWVSCCSANINGNADTLERMYIIDNVSFGVISLCTSLKARSVRNMHRISVVWKVVLTADFE